ncbi:Cut9-interacting protein scn1 [Coemansia sp. RSA 1813]|nr:Cut9-interacting protein scn1 [Coemansia sp. RSA 1646]KAJ1772932.1 Cut9-interacting protein scn1 [Coemansia sp. RSA 1843]KAJ2093507.1 Cut9-interacting protein scn1 [Coemansia sp. RSA 986]KAJ2214324.1 Cut9-interacting protein scn1 [Coemansia sp. RSA 487]KAJ2568890.1 Cut9-interacting protein scn1 [Coemansia sp. RSA 1813]
MASEASAGRAPLPCIYDVHCHIHETPASLDTLGAGRVFGSDSVVFCTQATQYTDWDDVKRLKEQCNRRIIPAFGLHPWFVERVQSGEIPFSWRDRLRELLQTHGGILGECGLDKIAKNPATHKLYPFEPQIQLFKEQLQIAHDLSVPVSVHCVRAFGSLVDVLKEAEAQGMLPPRIMLHSYSGSPDMLRQILFKGQLGKHIYISFSWFVNGRNEQKSRECIAAVPEDRLLIESDLHDAKSAFSALEHIIRLVASARGWALEEACCRLAANSRAFFGMDTDIFTTISNL